MKKLICIALVISIVACNNSGQNNADADTRATKGIIDSSAIMNDSTLLPNDSAATGVMH